MKFSRLTLVLALAGLPFSVHATNGMLMEGYGPIATALGGAAMAHDNGNAAMANNPAALGLMAEGARLDVALGFIGPDVKSDVHGKSKADAFYMPAFGYVKKPENWPGVWVSMPRAAWAPSSRMTPATCRRWGWGA